MDVREKFKKLTNPKKCEDYGLVMDRSELEQIPEGRFLINMVENQKATMRKVANNRSCIVTYKRGSDIPVSREHQQSVIIFCDLNPED